MLWGVRLLVNLHAHGAFEIGRGAYLFNEMLDDLNKVIMVPPAGPGDC